MIFSVFIALIETVGIAAIMPFISVASDFDVLESNSYYKYAYDLFEFKSNVIAFGGGLNIFTFYQRKNSSLKAIISLQLEIVVSFQ